MSEIVKEPILKTQLSEIENGYNGPWNYRYRVECVPPIMAMCLTYAEYVSLATDSNFTDLISGKTKAPRKLKCLFCKRDSLVVCDGKRGSMPDESPHLSCCKCDSTYNIVDYLRQMNLNYCSHA